MPVHLKRTIAISISLMAMTLVAYAGNADILPPVGEERCYARYYDNKHLAAHPQQTVTSMVLKLWYYSDDPIVSHAFGIAITRRGDAKRYVTGDSCRQISKSEGVICSITGDMGYFHLKQSRTTGSVNLELERLVFSNFYTAADDEPTEEFVLERGIDDKVFRLDPAPLSKCKGLER